MERYMYIKYNDDNIHNNSEQSDVVLILLNLGSVPDIVARSFNVSTEFAYEFKEINHEYKSKFERTHKTRWRYSTMREVFGYIDRKRRLDEVYEREHESK